MIDILERWEKTNLLRGVPQDIKAEMAYVLQNQIEHNAHIQESNNLEIPAFRRLSIPLARRVFPNLESHKRYTVTAKPYLESCLVTDLGIRGCWETGHDASLVGRSPNNLEHEAQQVAELAQKIVEGVDRFIKSRVPFNSFSFQCLGTSPSGNVTLYYDLE